MIHFYINGVEVSRDFARGEVIRLWGPAKMEGAHRWISEDFDLAEEGDEKLQREFYEYFGIEMLDDFIDWENVKC
jgi:hypothetical protein